MKVLVIEDSDSVLDMLESVLKMNDHEVITSTNAREGLSAIKTTAFDLVISDLILPGMDGIDLSEEIRKLGLELPIILFTAEIAFPVKFKSRLDKIKDIHVIENKDVSKLFLMVKNFVTTGLLP
jgi:DNA-binding NtrC family response regulator